MIVCIASLPAGRPQLPGRKAQLSQEPVYDAGRSDALHRVGVRADGDLDAGITEPPDEIPVRRVGKVALGLGVDLTLNFTQKA